MMRIAPMPSPESESPIINDDIGRVHSCYLSHLFNESGLLHH
jgi:hypothetical protein